MKLIYKYPFALQGRTAVQMPRGAKVLTVQAQRGEAVLWAIVDPEAPAERREFLLCGTGVPTLPDDIEEWWTYLGTFQLGNSTFVGHLFERRR